MYLKDLPIGTKLRFQHRDGSRYAIYMGRSDGAYTAITPKEHWITFAGKERGELRMKYRGHCYEIDKERTREEHPEWFTKRTRHRTT